ncbi:cytochrome P450 [Aspergillus clavatus NRRL 1]|uniref:Benzoate 4-monooxygenase cytochrome P450 n=1 Tax=Aspergillus clavatus (strain ATCC 1007 / CBS 513.65 / DSM 816 / NCTC 3887 / NRRL 1 / QM 1276 / 107) TaxID=344612 RepID=A1C4J4_ASPCL|nr:benzoate 4-monooxygenase cytochrome P450 [Aspergillus clavatus NRRL 1]EAW15334.1 benzoate 4-monooxygenase cytochrome P450 [Aspergillus clavatus NRRL 1]
MGVFALTTGLESPSTPGFWVLAFLSLVATFAVKRKYSTALRDIPGPFLASFSSLWKVYQVWKGHTEEEMIRLHKKHGYFVRIAENEVSVSHPDAVRQILHAKIVKGPMYAIFSIPDYHYVNQMSELNPRRHIEKTRNVAAGYALSNIIKSEAYVDTLLQLLKTRLDGLSESGTPVEFDRWFNYFAFDVVGEVTFSKSFGFVESGTDIRNAIANTRALALYIALMNPYVRLHNLTLGNPLLSRLGIQPSSHIFDTCLAAIDARKNNPDSRNDMMERWLHVRATYPDRMAENEVFAVAVANIGAGADTVSATLQALVYHLLRSPGHLQRLRAEIDAAKAKGELSAVVQYAEAQRLPFLQACIKEAYRFHSAVGLGLPRVVPKAGMTIAGRHFTEGTILSVNPWVFHRNPALFGADCDTFNPERWLDKERCAEMDSYLIHWGAGYNQCPGRNLAHFEISKLAATLFRDYEIEQIHPKQEWMFENHFTVVPYNWPCRIRRR